MTGESLAAMRAREQEDAARLAGVARVEFLGYADGTVEPSLMLRRDLSRLIRKWRPQAVICQDPTVFFSSRGYINHPDHRAVGEAALGAIYPSARDALTFPELAQAGFEPHKVQEVFVSMSPESDVIVDITATFDAKIAALLAHRSQMGEWNPTEMISKWSSEAAKDQPFEFGEMFRYIKLE